MFDAAERKVAPRAEALLASELFLDTLSVAAKAQARTRRFVTGPSEAVWRALNLPVRSDVVALRRQVARLDREVHDVSRMLEGMGVDRRDISAERPARR